MSAYLDYLRSTGLYTELLRLPAPEDSDLLDHTDDCTADAQVEFLRWALQLANPQVLLETGTHRGFFGYLVSSLTRGATLHTMDCRAGASHSIELLNSRQGSVVCAFYHGDSRIT